MRTSFFEDMLNRISDRGRQLLDLSGFGFSNDETIESLSKALLSGRGEASGFAIAFRILNAYKSLDDNQRAAYFEFLVQEFSPDPTNLAEAARAYLNCPENETLKQLTYAVESPRLEFLHRLNLAPGATADIVKMRKDLLDLIKGSSALAAVDRDFISQLNSWFNRGFLVLQRVDWSTPANILEKIINYEAVHEIRGWEDLRRRLDPADRRCFAYFHPSLVDEPLIFVQVALTRRIPSTITEVLEEERREPKDVPEPTTAVFYSISNCQEGLRGISFGNFLIKHVVEDLTREIPSLKTFVTLSPIPGFSTWLQQARSCNLLSYLDVTELAILDNLADESWVNDKELAEALEPVLMAAASHYFLLAKNVKGRPVDPVARFHLGNGARLERINWLGNTSPRGMQEAHGLMVNYCYDLRDIERNHELFAHSGIVAASKSVRSNLRAPAEPGSLVVVDHPAAQNTEQT